MGFDFSGYVFYQTHQESYWIKFKATRAPCILYSGPETDKYLQQKTVYPTLTGLAGILAEAIVP